MTRKGSKTATSVKRAGGVRRHDRTGRDARAIGRPGSGQLVRPGAADGFARTRREVAAGPMSQQPPQPSFAEPPKLRRRQTCREALILITRETFRQIAANRKVVLETDDPEGAHQLRVGLTRLRAALKLFRPLLEPSRIERLELHARALARSVGQLRDADVLIGDIVAPAAAVAGADAAAFAELEAALAAHRIRMRDRARATLASEEWSALLLELTLLPGTLGDCRRLDERLGRYTRHALDRTWKKVAGKGRRIDELDAEQRHAMRKSLKRLRYGAEFLRKLHDRHRVRPFVKRLRKLQAIFGTMNDVEMSGILYQIANEAPGDRGAAMKAAGFTLGWHTARLEAAWHHARADWKTVSRTKKFWH